MIATGAKTRAAPSGGSAGDVVTVARLHACTIAQAFACGRARNATLQILNDYPNWHSHLPEVQAAITALYDPATFRYHENLVHDYWMDGLGDARRAAYTAGDRDCEGHTFYSGPLTQLMA